MMLEPASQIFHDGSFNIDLELEQIHPLPVRAIEGQDVPQF
jgi:hypothetical protein